MSFQNVYYKRATATPRACYVCSKPSTTCLATINAVDFIYTCDSHLSDTSFATEIILDSNASKKDTTVSPEEIARIKAEWEAKEARKKKKDKDKERTRRLPQQMVGVARHPWHPSSPSVTTPTYKRYSLHRDFYAMRQAEHRRRKKAKQTQELAPRLPGAPHGSL
ncbi:AAA-ATPase Vps4-associated protein 1-domain-containing protein [Lactifluus volemus]|nr:AAA-ATPase Vps4-associated protein 1-domain-containing protein [Lactifluus volemus]